MTDTTEQTPTFTPNWTAASERVMQAGERLTTASRQMTGAYLDGVEKIVAGMTGYERKLSEQPQLGPVAGLLQAQADLTDQLTSSSLRIARELIAA